MHILTAEQMQKVDEETIDRVCPGIELMERAGRGVAEVIMHKFGAEGPRKIVIFVGPGNNGGDGLVVARYLAIEGWRVTAHLLKPVDKMTPDTAKNDERLSQLEDTAHPVVEVDATRPDWIERAEEDIVDADVLVDCIFGTGISGAPRGTAMDMIQLINDVDLPVVSVDIPSGVSGSTGETPGEAVIATHTLTIGAPKIGTLFHPGKYHCGEVSVIDIGFPDDIIAKYADDTHLLDQGEAAARLPFRAPDTHKFDAGTLLMVAGSAQYRGAALLAAEAALRSGCGMVYLGVVASIRAEIDVALREVITVALPETADGTVAPEAIDVLQSYAERAHAVAIGPGMGRNADTDAFIRDLVSRAPLPVVVDADGITAFAGRAADLANGESAVVVTPHSGELGRLLGTEVPEGALERIAFTRQAAADLNVAVLHKGAPSLVAAPDGAVYVATAGSSALATGGTGDVLTGLVGGMLAQGAEPFDAALVATHLHGKAGDVAAAEMGKRGVIASDLLWAMGQPLAQLEALVGD